MNFWEMAPFSSLRTTKGSSMQHMQPFQSRLPIRTHISNSKPSGLLVMYSASHPPDHIQIVSCNRLQVQQWVMHCLCSQETASQSARQGAERSRPGNAGCADMHLVADVATLSNNPGGLAMLCDARMDVAAGGLRFSCSVLPCAIPSSSDPHQPLSPPVHRPRRVQLLLDLCRPTSVQATHVGKIEDCSIICSMHQVRDEQMNGYECSSALLTCIP